MAFAPELAKASEGFEAAFFEQLAEFEPNHFWFEVRNRLIIWALQQFFGGVISSGSFLELGCGTGFVISGIHRLYPLLSVSGNEIFVEGLAFARKRLSNIRLFQMDARYIPVVNEFDVIGAFDVEIGDE